jgi:putative nucleotidyltransferase with HDIG domain
MMGREDAEATARQAVSGDALLKHMLATGAIMGAAARELGEDAELWEVTGLLHDVDFERTKAEPIRHGVLAQEMLSGKDLPKEALHAILAHNYMNPDAKRSTKMEHMLVASDSITGLIIACAMVKGKKLENVTTDTVKNAFRKKGFAGGSRRDMIMECEPAGVPYARFVEISLEAMKGISGALGL